MHACTILNCSLYKYFNFALKWECTDTKHLGACTCTGPNALILLLILVQPVRESFVSNRRKAGKNLPLTCIAIRESWAGLIANQEVGRQVFICCLASWFSQKKSSFDRQNHTSIRTWYQSIPTLKSENRYTMSIGTPCLSKTFFLDRAG